jgi:tRNA threonylcarbamoyl adenosine modification protein YeaZ
MSERVVLALELSTTLGQVAVVRGGVVLYRAEFVSERSHNSLLFSPLGEALDVAGGELDRIVVGTGPGSYTGVRIGIAAAQGIALSRGVPVIGWPSIAAPDAAGAEKWWIIGDARRGSFYLAEVGADQKVGSMRVMGLDEIMEWLARNGDKARLTTDARLPVEDAGIALCRPSAVKLAEIAGALSEEAVSALASEALQPLYVTEAFITKAKRPFRTE